MALNFKKLISPNGTAEVFTNGTHDVFDKKDVDVEVKGEPYEFDTYEKMEEFLRSDESKYGDIVKYTGAWDTKQYFQFGLMKSVPNDNGIYPRVPILFNTDLTNDEVKQIITNANLTFNYANSLNGIPFNEYIIFSSKMYRIGDTPSDNGVMYEINMRVSLISSIAFPGEYVIFAFEDDNPVPYTWWSSIDIPDLNISNGWDYNNVGLAILYNTVFNSTYDGADVGSTNDKLTKLVGIFDDSLKTSEEFNDGNYFIITNDNNNSFITDKSKYYYKLINQYETDLSFDVTKNGEYHVKGFEKVNVNVTSSGELTWDKGVNKSVATNILPSNNDYEMKCVHFSRNGIDAYHTNDSIQHINLITGEVTDLSSGMDILTLYDVFFETLNGDIYIGNTYYNLYHLSKEKVLTKLEGVTITSFFESSNGDVYAFHNNNNNGVYYLNGNIATKILDKGYNFTFFETSDGYVYTSSGYQSLIGLYCLNKEVATKIYELNYYWQFFFETSKGDVYVSSYKSDDEGILKLNGTEVTKIYDAGYNWAYFIETPSGDIYVSNESEFQSGVSRKGIYKLVNDQLTQVYADGYRYKLYINDNNGNSYFCGYSENTHLDEQTGVFTKVSTNSNQIIKVIMDNNKRVYGLDRGSNNSTTAYITHFKSNESVSRRSIRLGGRLSSLANIQEINGKVYLFVTTKPTNNDVFYELDGDNIIQRIYVED